MHISKPEKRPERNLASKQKTRRRLQRCCEHIYRGDELRQGMAFFPCASSLPRRYRSLALVYMRSRSVSSELDASLPERRREADSQVERGRPGMRSRTRP